MLEGSKAQSELQRRESAETECQEMGLAAGKCFKLYVKICIFW